MGLSVERLPGRLPRRFPVGAAYVVEGYGAADGDLRIIARYVVLPDGKRINVPAAPGRLAPAPRALTLRRKSTQRAGQRPARPSTKKIATRPGTGSSRSR
jgi:hypothetical protein